MPEVLEKLIRAGTPTISIETSDEKRAFELVQGIATKLFRPFYEWSMTTGLCEVKPSSERGKPVVADGKAVKTLQHILKTSERAIYLFKDLGPHCKDAHVHRLLRDLQPACCETKSTLVLLDALSLPTEVQFLTVRFDVPWPTSDELELVVRKTFQRIDRESLQKVTAKLSKREMEQLVSSLRGLSCDEAERVIASAIYDDYNLGVDDLPHIIESKRTLLGSSGCLEAIATDFAPGDIGGLKNLKAWLKVRRGGFSKRARAFGLESPRGVLMLGIPGCGKSLCAKAIAAEWHMPLLRLDPGVLYQKFIGESESQLRRALAQAEAMAPVVLWIDEIEKAFASASAASADGGLSKRMFGTLLAWMQDHRHPIFIIATANDVSALPPELMRKGRFDEIFFIDLPKAKAREHILRIHLQRRKRDPKQFDMKELAAASEGFSGSELEQAVISALFAAYVEKKELANHHIVDELKKTKPLSVMQAEKVRELQLWAEERCVLAD